MPNAVAAPPRVRERPIPFSRPMMLAILGGRKTQTRRVIVPQPPSEVTDVIPLGHEFVASYPNRSAIKPFVFKKACRYGERGDRLWVREAHALEWGERIVYRADRAAQYVQDFPFGGTARVGQTFWVNSDHEPDRWRPSIHMPRWASRLTLEITDVRVERVQDI
ncbi:MAG TPA: hypothetical protein VN513_10175, partial [Gemmatimonadales bacterium]|nr:hypothetical protein [Gemmatimonadales bacterium]